MRKVLIQVMLWSLAATAGLAALSALTGSGDAGGRFVGTGIAFAVATGVMLPMAVRAEKPETRLDGLAGMALTVVLLLGVVSLIWGIWPPLLGRRGEDAIGQSLLFLGGGGFVIVLCLRLLAMPPHRLASVLAISTTGVALMLVLLATWVSIHNYGPDERWAGSAAAVGGMGALAAVALSGRDKRRPWRWIGVAASLGGMGVGIYAAWFDMGHHNASPLVILIAIAAVVAHANLCLQAPLSPGQRWIPYPVIAAFAATQLFVVLIVWAQDQRTHFEMAEKLASAAGILATTGSLALLVLAKINKQPNHRPVLAQIEKLTLICPACDLKQEMAVGRDASCAGCGLLFNILIVEPRCPQCDYLLYKLQSNRCPECGFVLKDGSSVTAVAVPGDLGKVRRA